MVSPALPHLGGRDASQGRSNLPAKFPAERTPFGGLTDHKESKPLLSPKEIKAVAGGLGVGGLAMDRVGGAVRVAL